MSDYSGIFSYRPERVSALRSRTIAALEQVRHLLIDIHGAPDARAATSNLRQILETQWLSFLDTLWNSNAMSEWRRTNADTAVLDAQRCSVATMPAALDAGRRTITLDEGGCQALQQRWDDFFSADRDWTVTATDSATVAEFRNLVTTSAHYGFRPTLSRRQLAAALEIIELLVISWKNNDPYVADVDIGNLAYCVGSVLSDPLPFQEEITGSLLRSDALIILGSEYDRHFGDDTFAYIATLALAQDSTNPGRHRRISYPGALGNLIAKATATPSRTRAVAERLAGSPEAIRSLVTSRDLDRVEIEQVIIDLLTKDSGLGIYVLAGIVAASQTSELTGAALRGTAQGLDPLLPQFAPTLDHRLPVTAFINGVGVSVGTYDELAGLVLQIIKDPQASIHLGITLANYRSDSLGRAAADIEAELDLQPGQGAVLLAVELGGGIRFIDLIWYSAEANAKASAQQIEHNRRLAGNIVDIAAAIGSGLPGVGGAIAGSTLAASKIGVDAILDRPVEFLDPLAGDDLWTCRSLHGILMLPANRKDLRQALGVDQVPQHIWTDIANLIARFEREPEHRSHLHANIQSIIAGNPSLRIYVTQVLALSGEAHLAAPPPVSGHTSGRINRP